MKIYRPDFRVGALLVAAVMILAACTGGEPGDDGDASATTDIATTTSTIPTYVLDAMSSSDLANLAGCVAGSGATLLTVTSADLIDVESGDEQVASIECSGDSLGRVVVLSAGNEMLAGPVVGREPRFIGTDPVRLLTYVIDTGLAEAGDRVLETVHRWIDGELRPMSESRITFEEYLRAIGQEVVPDEPLSRADLVDRATPAVVRLSAEDCDGSGSGTGTGFLVTPSLVVTAAHVVEGTRQMEVQLSDGTTLMAQTIGFAPGQDTALVQLPEPLTAVPLTWTDEEPRVGSDITVLGYPLGLDLSVTAGTISGVGRTIRFPNQEEIPNVLQTDALTNPGNSGGPWLDDRGRIVGLHIAGRDNAQGINWGVEAAVVRDLVAQWETEPQPYAPCAPPEAFPVAGSVDHLALEDVRAMLSDYAGGITVGDYALAHDRLWNPTTTVERWSADLSSSVWSEVEIIAIEKAPDDVVAEFAPDSVDSLSVSVRAVTTQAARFGPDGQACTVWMLKYLLATEDGVFWKIASSKGSVPTAC